MLNNLQFYTVSVDKLDTGLTLQFPALAVRFDK